jgi:hypothetical protein
MESICAPFGCFCPLIRKQFLRLLYCFVCNSHMQVIGFVELQFAFLSIKITSLVIET